MAGERARRALRRRDLFVGLRPREAGRRDLPVDARRARRRAQRRAFRRRRRQRRARRRGARRDDARPVRPRRPRAVLAGGARVGWSTRVVATGGAGAVLITTMNDVPGYTIE